MPNKSVAFEQIEDTLKGIVDNSKAQSLQIDNMVFNLEKTLTTLIEIVSEVNDLRRS